jgi:hypothetical protein
MANIWWGNGWTKAFVKKDELREALSLENDLMFGCWLGVVGERGHDEAIRWAWNYDGILRGEFGEDEEVDVDVLEARRVAWNAGESAKIDDDEIEKRRCGLSDWNLGKRKM